MTRNACKVVGYLISSIPISAKVDLIKFVFFDFQVVLKFRIDSLGTVKRDQLSKTRETRERTSLFYFLPHHE